MERIKIALVSETKRLSARELTRVAEALNIQLSDHFQPEWHIAAGVRPFRRSKDVPKDYWPITVRDNIGDEGMMSFHSIKGQRPFVEVTYGENWTLGASHDMLEMLVDPRVGRTVMAPSVVPGDRRRVEYAVQICDPCASRSYRIGAAVVADFSTQDYWDSKSTRKGRYSYLGALTKPFQVVRGGYLSWQDPETKEWCQKIWRGKKPEYQGPHTVTTSSEENNAGSIRVQSAGRVKFRTLLLQDVYYAQEANRMKIQTAVESLIRLFG